MYSADLHIEACQAESAECAEKRTRNESQSSQIFQLVCIHQCSCGNAEGNIIGQGIELNAHRSCRMQSAGYAPVQSICHHGNQYEYSCQLVMS